MHSATCGFLGPDNSQNRYCNRPELRICAQECGLSIPLRPGRSVFKPRSKVLDCVLPEVVFAAAMP